jgi:hypothetical protein
MANLAKQQVREPVRAPLRTDVRLKPGQALGRDGEIITRNKNFEDPYNIPEAFKEPGWSYQWNRLSAYNEPDPVEINRMMDNGWRYVKPDTRLGRMYTSPGHNKDFIEIGGLVLMERPQSLTDEAIEEQRMKTAEQYDNLMGKSTDLIVPDGFKKGKKVTRGEREVLSSDMRPTLNPRTDVPDDD